jgi:hypothetical protein
MQEADHYLIHVRHEDAQGKAEWRVTMPHNEVGAAVREALQFQSKGLVTFITGRNDAAEILFVMPVAAYPIAGVVNFDTGIFGCPDERTRDAVIAFADKVGWTA